MDTLTKPTLPEATLTLRHYQQIIERVLAAYADVRYANGEITNEAVFDREHNHFLVVSVGWQGSRRVQHCLLHLDLVDGKVWIQRDGTENGIADELESAGVPRRDIVLAFHPVQDRALLTDYATL